MATQTPAHLQRPSASAPSSSQADNIRAHRQQDGDTDSHDDQEDFSHSQAFRNVTPAVVIGSTPNVGSSNKKARHQGGPFVDKACADQIAIP
jgi:hypothetical protein